MHLPITEDASTTSDNVTEAESVEPSEATLPTKSVDDRLIDEPVGRARAAGLQLTGGEGLLQQLTKRLPESALKGGITGHLGYDKHDPAGKNGGN
ncbi:transposase [Streptomyces sp. NPDC014734]|uniref:transposase n=1 Tax=Streptomyces sp. NPDC014734 TaxID=3364886 RepID=UPI0036FA8DCA